MAIGVPNLAQLPVNLAAPAPAQRAANQPVNPSPNGYPLGNPSAMMYDPISGMPMSPIAMRRLLSKNYNRLMDTFLEYFESKEREKAEETLQSDESS